MGHAILAPGSGDFTVFGADGTLWLGRNGAGTLTESRVKTPPAVLDTQEPATFLFEPLEGETKTPLANCAALAASPTRYQTAVSDLTSFDEQDDDDTWMELVNWNSADAVTTSHYASSVQGLPPSEALVTGEDTDLGKLPHQDSGVNPGISQRLDHDSLFNDLEDADLLHVLDGVCTACDSRIPPNVNRPLESDEEEDVDVDRSSAYSSPDTLSSSGLNTFADQGLDEDVDWEAVIASTDELEQQPLLSNNSAAANTTRAKEHCLMPRKRSDCHASKNTSSTVPASPFVRPPLPSPTTDRSPIPGLSPATVTRTCFRVGELVNAAAQCWKEDSAIRPAVVFELFARVAHSSRDPAARTQSFQFKDLFTDHQPYPAGTLRNWKPGSIIDQQARLLGGEGKDRTCRCVCRVQRDLRDDLGWALEMHSVRETTWDEIQWVRRILARDDPEL